MLWFVVSLEVHCAVVCCLSYKAGIVASLAAHCAVVCCLSFNAWFVASLLMPGLLPLILHGLLSLL